MLGAYPMVALGRDPVPRKYAELDRYLRWEYGSGTSVAAFLAEVTQVPKKSRTKGRKGVAQGIRAFTKALGSLIAGRRSKIPTQEV